MDKLIGLCGSLRAGSLNRKLLHQAATLYGDCAFQEMSLDLPLYNGDVEARGIPQTVLDLSAAIKDADAIIIATPEYNKGISGVLKNALDWISRTQGGPFTDKPVALLTAAAGRTGGETAQYHTRHCLTPLGADVIASPAICIAAAATEFNSDCILENQRYIDNITTLMVKLSKRVQHVKS